MTDDRYRPTLSDISHTHPHTGEAFGSTQAYGRGRTVAADGGDGDESEETVETSEETDETMADVSHTAPRDADGTQVVYDRGGEGDEEV